MIENIEECDVDLTVVKKYNFWDSEPIETGYLRVGYFQQLIGFLHNSLIKVVLGQRRVGKSYLLRSIIYYLLKELNIPAQNILYINKDLHDLSFITNREILMEVIAEYQKTMKPKGKIYLFLDEIQEIEEWEKAINSLSQDYTQSYEIFITGSNANLLSSELGTYLSGRYVEFTVYPFSYTEYLGYKKAVRNKETFLNYLKSGGIPEIYHLTGSEIQKNYISALKDSIVLRDIVHRHAIRDVYLLEKIIDFLLDSIGSLFSIASIAATLKKIGASANYETLSSYLKFLQEAFFIHECERFDIKGKHILTGERKYYLNDLAFKFYSTFSFDLGLNRFLENAVFLDLKRKGYHVYVGSIDRKEIDFVGEKNGNRIYVQVAYLLTSENIIAREFNNLISVSDHYPKYVVSLDEVNYGNKTGIMHRAAWDFID